MQEVTGERYVDIPGAVLDVYRLWRPSPLHRARRLEKALDTPAHIYYKYEGVSPVGSHKPNTAVPQAYYNAKNGVRRLTTETGAGQWGAALAFACSVFGARVRGLAGRRVLRPEAVPRHVDADVRRRGAPIAQRPHRGRAPLPRRGPRPPRLARDRHLRGSRGRGAQADDTRYALGSVLNHVLLHQTVIGQEALRAVRDGRRDARRDRRMHRRGVELRRARASRSCARSWPARSTR